MPERHLEDRTHHCKFWEAPQWAFNRQGRPSGFSVPFLCSQSSLNATYRHLPQPTHTVLLICKPPSTLPGLQAGHKKTAPTPAPLFSPHRPSKPHTHRRGPWSCAYLLVWLYVFDGLYQQEHVPLTAVIPLRASHTHRAVNTHVTHRGLEARNRGENEARP